MSALTISRSPSPEVLKKHFPQKGSRGVVGGIAKERRRRLREQRRLIELGERLLDGFKVASTLNPEAQVFVPANASRPKKRLRHTRFTQTVAQGSSGDSPVQRARERERELARDPRLWLLERARTYPFMRDVDLGEMRNAAFVRIIEEKLREYGVPPMEQCDGLLRNLAEMFDTQWESEHPPLRGLKGYQTLLDRTRHERERETRRR